MAPLPDCRTIARETLPAVARGLRAEGWRLVTATCLPRPAGWTVIYHFERSERLCHLRVEVAPGTALPAIDEAYPAAFLVENEMHELQGLLVSGLSIDYEGRLYRDFDGREGEPHPAPAAAASGRSPAAASAPGPPAASGPPVRADEGGR